MNLIGITKDDAIKICKNYDYEYRIVHEDGKDYMITCDFNFNRVNLTIINNIIIEADIG
jgi:hypothetical protein